VLGWNSRPIASAFITLDLFGIACTYVRACLAFVLAHSTSSFTLSTAFSGTGVPAQKLIPQDPSTPSGRVEPGGDSLILADRAAAPDS
jgi:hypothetical protein